MHLDLNVSSYLASLPTVCPITDKTLISVGGETINSYGKCADCGRTVAESALQLNGAVAKWPIVYEGDGLFCKECWKKADASEF